MKNLANGLFHVVAIDERAPRCGGLLVAEPFLKESYFNHGVISIIEYASDEGATGVVMNNRTEYMLSELLDGVSPEADQPVYCGGLLGLDRLYFIHTLGPDVIPDGRPIGNGLYVGGDFDSVIEYINSGYPADGNIRFFIGYSSWGAGQLEREIREGTWAQAPLPSEPQKLLEGNADPYWHRNVRALGEAYRPWQLLPRYPAYN